jgi:thiol-disulfide isomerase/thioredoxin
MINGCRGDEPERDTNNKVKTEDIEVIDHNRLKEIISNRGGSYLFINVWATWCAPCVAEFPDLVKLKQHYGDDLEFIALSVDHPSEVETLVVPFLSNHNVNFPVYIIDDNYSEEIIELLNLEWSGAIPASFIYDKDGQQKVFIIGAHSFEYFMSNVDSVKKL